MAPFESRAAKSPGPGAERSILTVGGIATGVGSLGVVATGALYALSPPAAASPMQPLDLGMALAGAIAGASTMRAAGTVGIFSDIVMATGALLVALDFARRGRGVAAAGWVAILLSIIVFTLVDALVGYVLVPLASAKASAGAFLGFKLLFDTLFLLGTVAFGAGAGLAMASEYRASAPVVDRSIALAAALVGLVGVVAAAACFARLPLELAVGASIGLGAVLFTVIGMQIARPGLKSH